MMARSVVVPSSVTRMVSYMGFGRPNAIFGAISRDGQECPPRIFSSSAGDDLPGGFQRVGQAVDVHDGDQDSTGPTGKQQKAAVLPIAHALAGTGELQQRKHGERKLQREYDLAEGQQFGDAAISAEANDENGREDGEGACDQAADPGTDAPVHEAFHHDLAGECARDGAALTACEERYGEQSAGGGGPEEWSERQVRDADPVAVGGEVDEAASRGGDTFFAEENCCRQNKNGSVDEECDGEGDDGINGVEADGAADRRFVFLQLAALH